MGIMKEAHWKASSKPQGDMVLDGLEHLQVYDVRKVETSVVLAALHTSGSNQSMCVLPQVTTN